MDKRKIILISVAILLVIIILLLIWWFFIPDTTDDVPPADLTNTNMGLPLSQRLDELPPTDPDRAEQNENYPLGLKQLALSFAERFGSYSDDEPYKNLLDLKTLMTSKMRQEIDQTISDLEANSSDDGLYEGYETQALNSQLLSYDSISAEILIQTRRIHYRERDATVSNDTFSQDLWLKAVKVNNEWKIDDANWQ